MACDGFRIPVDAGFQKIRHAYRWGRSHSILIYDNHHRYRQGVIRRQE